MFQITYSDSESISGFSIGYAESVEEFSKTMLSGEVVGFESMGRRTDGPKNCIYAGRQVSGHNPVGFCTANACY